MALFRAGQPNKAILWNPESAPEDCSKMRQTEPRCPIWHPSDHEKRGPLIWSFNSLAVMFGSFITVFFKSLSITLEVFLGLPGLFFIIRGVPDGTSRFCLTHLWTVLRGRLRVSEMALLCCPARKRAITAPFIAISRCLLFILRNENHSKRAQFFRFFVELHDTRKTLKLIFTADSIVSPVSKVD